MHKAAVQFRLLLYHGTNGADRVNEVVVRHPVVAKELGHVVARAVGQDHHAPLAWMDVQQAIQ